MKMKFLIILITLLFINISFAQRNALGAVKFSYNDSLMIKSPIEKLYVTCISKKYKFSDTNELNMNGTSKMLMLRPGKYTILISSNSFSDIKYRNVLIVKSMVTFIDLQLIKRTKRLKTLRIKYKKPITKYKNCG